MRPDPEMIPVLIDAAKGLKGSLRPPFGARRCRRWGGAASAGPWITSAGAGTLSAKARTNSAPA